MGEAVMSAALSPLSSNGWAEPASHDAALNTSDPDLQEFLGQFDSVIQAYNRFLADPAHKNVLPDSVAPIPSPRRASPHAHANTCSSCTSPVLPADRFCSSCGTPLAPWQPQQNVAATPLPAPSPAAQPQHPTAAPGLQGSQGSPLPPDCFDIELVRALMKERTRLHPQTHAPAADSHTVTTTSTHTATERSRSKGRQPMQATRTASTLSGTPLRSRSARNRELSFDSRASTSFVSHASGKSRASRGRSVGGASHRTNASLASGCSAVSEKQKMLDLNKADTSLQGGYFLPQDLRGSQSFSREKRFRHPQGFQHEQFAFYFLDDQVSNEIKTVRSKRGLSLSSRQSEPSSMAMRGSYNGNVTTKWGLSDGGGGGSTPGPGAYQPLFAKRS